MNPTLAEQVVSSFGLNAIQKQAALERGRNVVVTAGAGCGKTSTLVARYASLLADDLEPRRVIAITFTEKAAREMRSRVRDALTKLTAEFPSGDAKQKWFELSNQMDSARIGTIHSLCAEILRTHPAEAGIDPRFVVLDEGLASALRAQVVNDTLIGFVKDPKFIPLFKALTTNELSSLLMFLIEGRLDASEALVEKFDGNAIIHEYLEEGLRCPGIVDAIAELRRMSRSELEADGLASMVSELLVLWKKAEDGLQQGDTSGCADALYQARRGIKLNFGKKVSQTKDALKALRDAYDETLDPFVGGSNAKDQQPDPDAEDLLQQLMPLVAQAFEELSKNYRSALDDRQALDFDDLESGAEKLLAREDIRTRWQNELDALLVDEFQDTNARQRRIVDALAGELRGRLFVVGDARQSIYRFRRADVTVFRSIQEEVTSAGGLVLDLDQTYRAHELLLQATGDFLSAIMGTEIDSTRPYYVPFSPLKVDRKKSLEQMHAPHVELVFGTGEDAASARPVMAMALAKRLLELKNEKQIQAWDEVALLFRASSGFSFYENALEELSIPFVTVAGRGFYERAEIRDVLNLLRALSDPQDDLAMAGLLRSPAFGLSDAALYLLRKQGNETIPYWQALQRDITMLDAPDQERAQRTVELLNHLLPQVDRIELAELLKQLVDATDYRAILAAEGESSAGGRLWRNLDKLIADAQTSGHVNVRDFLDYLTTLSDAGARESEAPTDAQGAIRLMTIHKSKGLEFPVVVLADAGRERHVQSDQAYLLPEIGLALQLDPSSTLYRLAKWQDGLQDDLESLRILYVALTRAKEKLIISGHATSTSKGEWKSPEWMGVMADLAQVDLKELVAQAGNPVILKTSSGCPVRAVAEVASEEIPIVFSEGQSKAEDIKDESPLYKALVEALPESETYDEPEETYPWRATGEGSHIPPGVIGQMVHKAIELWLFPGDTRLVPLLEAAVLNAGLSSSAQRAEAVRRALELLERLRANPLWEEIQSSVEQRHEVPYSRMVGERSETGYIDLLFKDTSGWQIVDFKTDIIRSDAIRAELVNQYRFQMLRYEKAVETLLGQKPGVRICFLDDNGSANIIPVN